MKSFKRQISGRTAAISNAAGTQGLATGVEVDKEGLTITATQGTINGTALLSVTPD